MNSRLEQYVGELERGLDDLSETRRAEELQEVRQHLESSVRAYRELGLDEAEATQEAVRQFGAARKVSAGLRNAYWREKLFVTDSLWGTALLTVAIFLLFSSLFGGPIDVLGRLVQYNAAGSVLSVLRFSALAAFAWTPALVTGYLVGRLSPRHALVGSLVGKTVFAAYMIAWACAVAAVTATKGVPGVWGVFTQISVTHLIGIAVCVTGAYFGSRHVRAAKKRA